MTSASTLPLDSSQPRDHVVQLYAEPDGVLTDNVGRYLAEGLRRGDSVLVIATPEHSEGFLRHLERHGYSTEDLVRDERLTLLDAGATLAALMVDGLPEWSRFGSVVGVIVEEICGRAGARALRAYGEMVGLLWKDGNPEAAIRLEEYWNRLLLAREFSLFCAYPIDIFGRDFQIAKVDAILCRHSYLLPSGPEVGAALNRAMVEVLGPRLERLRPLIKANYRPSWAALPPAESVILWLRNNLRGTADEILTRAGRYYRKSHLNLLPESPEPS